jgi:endoglycosylceramidase
MVRGRVVHVLLAAFVLAVTLSTAGTAAQTTPRLQRQGRWLVDPHGRVVLVHGVNAVWKRDPYVPPATKAGFIDADAQWLARHGFNGARIGVLWVGVTPDAAGDVDTAYLQKWDRVVRLLADRHIWTLFDFHQDMMSPEYQGEGVPDWAVDPMKGPANTLPPPQFGFPFNYFTPQVSELYENLWAEHGIVWDGHRDAWKAVAAKWGDRPYTMGYDLLNEPWAGEDWPSCLAFPAGCPQVESDKLQPFFEHTLAGIRSVDPHSLVWFEPQTLSGGTGTPTGYGPVSGESQLGYSWHNYCPHAALLQAIQLGLVTQDQVDLSQTCGDFERRVFEQHLTTANRMRAANAVTEFGASDDLTIIRSVAALSDEHLTSWFYWHYKNWLDPTTQSQESGEQGLFAEDDDLSTLKMDKARLLVRTYPQATAGIPKKLSFDPDTGEMRYRYAPRAASAPTEIFISPLHYPKGYEVIVTGGHVLSDNGRIATIAPRRGVDTVQVIVRAADAGGDNGDGNGNGGDGGDDSGVGDAGGSSDLPATGGRAVIVAVVILGLGVFLIWNRG